MNKFLPPDPRKFFILLLILVMSFPLHSQEIVVTLRVYNQKKEPLSYASIIIINRLDSTTKVGMMADSSGFGSFKLWKNAQYLFRISAANYLTLEKGISFTGSQTHFIFNLEPSGKTLETAVVTAQKPLKKHKNRW